MVVPNTIEIPADLSGLNIYAATRIVSLIPGEGTDLTIASALAALPAEGGLIFVKQGTYPIAASLVIPDKPVEIRGAGDATIIDIGANVITAFTTAFDQYFSLESIRVTGNGSAGQGFFDYTGAAARVSQITFRNVLVGNYDGASNSIETMIRGTLAVINNVHVSDSFFVVATSVAGRFISSAAPGGDYRVERTHVTGTGGVSGNPQLLAENCAFSMGVVGMTLVTGSVLLNCSFSGASLVTIIAQGRVSGCIFDSDSHLRFTGSRNLVVNSVFLSVVATHIETIGAQLVVVGCTFANYTSEAVLITGTTGCVITGNENCEVQESGVGVNNNRYENNSGFLPTQILGAKSLIENENVVSTAVDVTLDEFNRTVTVDASGAARTITLPTATSAKWRKYIIKKTDATVNTVTIDAAGAETIDGALTFVLTVQYQAIEIESDGTTWWII